MTDGRTDAIAIKMPSVGILTFISGINTIFEGFKAMKVDILHHFTFYEHSKFMLS